MKFNIETSPKFSAKKAPAVDASELADQIGGSNWRIKLADQIGGLNVVIFGDNPLSKHVAKVFSSSTRPTYVHAFNEYLEKETQVTEGCRDLFKDVAKYAGMFDDSKILSICHPTDTQIHNYNGSVLNLLQALKPNLVINLYDDNRIGQTGSPESWNINLNYVKDMVKYANQTNTTFWHLSSGMVFNDYPFGLFSVNSRPLKGLVNTYQYQKHLAELEIISESTAGHGKFSIFRTGKLMGTGDHYNALTSIIRNLKNKDHFDAPDDDKWVATSYDLIAKYIFSRVKTFKHTDATRGTSRATIGLCEIDHIVESMEPTNTYQFAWYVKQAMNNMNKTIKNVAIHKTVVENYYHTRNLPEQPQNTALEPHFRWYPDAVDDRTNKVITNGIYEYDLMPFDDVIKEAINFVYKETSDRDTMFAPQVINAEYDGMKDPFENVQQVTNNPLGIKYVPKYNTVHDISNAPYDNNDRFRLDNKGNLVEEIEEIEDTIEDIKEHVYNAQKLKFSTDQINTSLNPNFDRL